MSVISNNNGVTWFISQYLIIKMGVAINRFDNGFEVMKHYCLVAQFRDSLKTQRLSDPKCCAK